MDWVGCFESKAHLELPRISIIRKEVDFKIEPSFDSCRRFAVGSMTSKPSSTPVDQSLACGKTALALTFLPHALRKVEHLVVAGFDPAAVQATL